MVYLQSRTGCDKRILSLVIAKCAISARMGILGGFAMHRRRTTSCNTNVGSVFGSVVVPKLRYEY
jgi:ABC-type spermidine/putrescine transport system permease subunit II